MTDVEAHLEQLKAEHDTHWALVKHFLERALNGRSWELAERDALLQLLEGSSSRLQIRFGAFGRALKGAEQKRYKIELTSLQQSYRCWTSDLQQIQAPAAVPPPAQAPIQEGYNHPDVAALRRATQFNEQREAIQAREDALRLQQLQTDTTSKIIADRNSSHYNNQRRWRDSPWPGEDRQYCQRCGRPTSYGPCSCY